MFGLVRGSIYDRPGLGYALAKAVGDAGINLGFVMAQVVDRRYAAVFGFENDADAGKAAALIRKAATRSAKDDSALDVEFGTDAPQRMCIFAIAERKSSRESARLAFQS